MELQRNADFMRGLGFADFQARAPVLDSRLPDNPAKKARGRYAVLIPGAAFAMRAWPRSAFAETGRRLAARGLALVLAGGSGDRTLAQALLGELPGPVEDFTGRTSLGELASLLAGARVVVSNETGAAHIAAAAGTPVVCATGGGHYGRFVPYRLGEGADTSAGPVAVIRRMDCFGCDWKCIYPRAADEAVKCIRDISPDDLWAKVEACLAQGGAAA
jgi:ADP-heptose:LPS heptosyltransferase